MSRPEIDPAALLPEAITLHTLSVRHVALSRVDEPPRWDRDAHSTWEDRWEQFSTDIALLQEELEILFKEWES